jgi:hypothetical protein
MKKHLENFVEWFFMLFFKKQANILKQETIFERKKAILDYEKAKEKNKKYLSKFSGRKRYVKSPID